MPPSPDPSHPAPGLFSEEGPAARTERFDLQALYETSRLLGSSLNLDFVLSNLLLTALSKLLVMHGAVLLWRPAEGGFRVAMTKGRIDLEAGAILSLESFEDVSAASASDPFPGGEPLRADEVPEPLRACGAALVLPFESRDRLLGLLALGPKATGAPFAKAELEFVASLAGMSATAIENALLVEELQQANRDLDGKVQELNTLFDLSQEMGATLDKKRLAKLLSFALMGQMAVHRHLFLLRQDPAGEDGSSPPFEAVLARGISADVTPALTEAICERRQLVYLADEASPPWRALHEAGLDVVLPIRHQEETCAALALGPKLTGQPYEAGDIEFLYALGNLAFTSLQNAHLIEEQIEKERLEKEIHLARDIQERLLPQQLPALPGAEIAARAVPSREVGGDYYDVLTLPGAQAEASEGATGKRLLLAIADVTGKGVPAALLMANVQAALKALVPTAPPLEELVARLNRVICQNTDAGTFITFFVAVYDPEAHMLDYVNAGHNPPMLVRASSAVERLKTGGLLLGVMSSAEYERGCARLEAGDRLVFFTDGATEAMNPAGEEYGEGRLQSQLRAHRTEPANAILEAVFEDIRAFAGYPPYLSDDLTMIVLNVQR